MITDLRYKIFVVIGVIVTTMFLIGCGTTKNTPKESIVWPPPPDEPRIEYVKTYQSEDDFLSKFGLFAQSLAGKSASIQLERPFGVCSDGQGRVFVTDVTQGIIVFDEVKKGVDVFGENVPVPLGTPLGIAYGHNKLFIGIGELGQVVVLTPEGKYVKSIGKTGAFPNPVGIAYDKVNNHLVIVDNKKHQIFIYSEDGDSLLTIGKRGTEDGEFNFPQSAVTDSLGNIYIVDAFNFRIEEFDSRGKFIRKYGKQGNVFGTFARPKGIALDSYQNIYVVDAIHQNYQIFDQNFSLLLFVGRFSNKDNWGFQNPVGIFIDQNNYIYVADQLNQRIQVFQLLKIK